MIAGSGGAGPHAAGALAAGTPVPGAPEAMPKAPSSPDLVGSVLSDRYRVLRKLGEGGMGSVYLAEHTTINKRLAIKVLSSEYSHKQDLVDRFLQEARAASMIEQENVVEITDFGSTPQGSVFFVMEYLNGEDLSRTIKKEGPLPWSRVKPIMVQICTALAAAHDVGIIHRDMKPENCYRISRGGNSDFIKVLDFGIAKVQDATVRTSTGAVKGTYAYMAPEQLRNEQIDRRVDVWAIGVVMWETLAQQHLFKRDTEFLTFEAITKLPIPDICEVRPDVPPLLGDTIARALSRNRDDRFASARALGEALAQAVAPLGGAAGGAAISDEVQHSFEATLAEQRMLLRIAREGGQFDLERSSPLLAHGTAISTTPVSNIQRRLEEAQAEVAQFAAAQQAIDSLYEDEGMRSRPNRFPTDGAFTPAEPRRSAVQKVASEPESGIILAEALPLPPAVNEPPAAPARRTMPVASPPRSSKLPWMIAIVAVVSAGAAAVLLYMEQKKMDDRPRPSATNEPVAKVEMPVIAHPAPPAVTPDAAIVTPDAAIAEPAVEREDDDEAEKPVAKKPERPRHERSKKTDKKPEQKIEKKIEKKIEPRDEIKKPDREDRQDRDDKPGFITIDSTPVYAVIYIDGKKYGETPLVNIKLAAGKHSVRAVSPSGSTQNLSIHIESGKTAPVRRIEW